MMTNKMELENKYRQIRQDLEMISALFELFDPDYENDQLISLEDKLEKLERSTRKVLLENDLTSYWCTHDPNNPNAKLIKYPTIVENWNIDSKPNANGEIEKIWARYH